MLQVSPIRAIVLKCNITFASIQYLFIWFDIVEIRVGFLNLPNITNRGNIQGTIWNVHSWHSLKSERFVSRFQANQNTMERRIYKEQHLNLASKLVKFKRPKVKAPCGNGVIFANTVSQWSFLQVQVENVLYLQKIRHGLHRILVSLKHIRFASLRSDGNYPSLRPPTRDIR